MNNDRVDVNRDEDNKAEVVETGRKTKLKLRLRTHLRAGRDAGDGGCGGGGDCGCW